LVLLGSGIACGSTSLGGGSDATIGIESPNGAIALLEDAATLFDHGLDILDQLLFVELVLGGAVSLLEALYRNLLVM
jgi:hypothetical protein